MFLRFYVYTDLQKIKKNNYRLRKAFFIKIVGVDHKVLNEKRIIHVWHAPIFDNIAECRERVGPSVLLASVIGINF